MSSLLTSGILGGPTPFLTDQMSHTIKAIYHIIAKSQCGLWAIRRVKGDLALRVHVSIHNPRCASLMSQILPAAPIQSQ